MALVTYRDARDALWRYNLSLNSEQSEGSGVRKCACVSSNSPD